VYVRPETGAHGTATGTSRPSSSVGGWARSLVEVMLTVNVAPAVPTAGLTIGCAARSGGTVSTFDASTQYPEWQMRFDGHSLEEAQVSCAPCGMSSFGEQEAPIRARSAAT